jgi:hypothetical protein
MLKDFQNIQDTPKLDKIRVHLDLLVDYQSTIVPEEKGSIVLVSLVYYRNTIASEDKGRTIPMSLVD